MGSPVTQQGAVTSWRGLTKGRASEKGRSPSPIKKRPVDDSLMLPEEIAAAMGPAVEDARIPGTRLNIQKYFEVSGYSIRRLSKVTDISETTLKEVTKNRGAMIRLDTLDILAWVFGCTAKDFFEGEPHHPPAGRFDLLLLPRAATVLARAEAAARKADADLGLPPTRPATTE